MRRGMRNSLTKSNIKAFKHVEFQGGYAADCAYGVIDILSLLV